MDKVIVNDLNNIENVINASIKAGLFGDMISVKNIYESFVRIKQQIENSQNSLKENS